MKYINIYLNKPSKNNTPIPYKSYNKQEYQYEEDSANIIIRTGGNRKTITSYGRYKYFCRLEDFNAVEEPNKILSFEEIQEEKRRAREELKIENAKSLLFWTPDKQEPKILNAAIDDEPKQEEPQQDISDDSSIKKPKTRQSQLDAVRRYEEKNKDNTAIVKLKVTPDYKEMLFDKAKSKGMTVTAYIKYLVDKDI